MRILIVGHFDTRESTAASLRVRGTAGALLTAGHDVQVIDVRMGRTDPRGWSIELSGLPILTGVSLDEYATGFLSHFPMGVRGMFIGDVTANYIREMSPRPDLIILYGTHLGYIRRLRKLCNELGIPLVLDIVEWYAAEDLPGGRFGPYAISNMLSMRRESFRADGFFVISERLAKHYSRAGKPIVTVPPLFLETVMTAEKWSEDDGRLHLVYAGSPGNKEAFETLIGGLSIAAAQGVALTWHLVGMTEADLRAVPGGSTWLDGAGATATICYGRIPNVRARRIVSRSDFSLLLRPLRRSNQFGFPSKLAESMTLGTPVIANRFSDLSRFLSDGENALLLTDLSNETFADAVMRAANHSPGIRNMMCASAQALARTHFCPQSHSRSMSDMLEKLRG
ncbi:glycosyltransferase [Sphingobium wenxiniae]|uniref:Glycosyltransferase involved in cell wall biosynthesis n=1 Tax=Sphingobium wenxiniae (strain DSM 21828 / CGMCC 1.7748 / JZ-1) TaxID=595605 RepID=A0A562K524_SPHWJ|nr:glycosyltransferase [Sphingobium wenxiniae]TWH90529.1 glycosyltransferase involved in cell wall biosynthesis [Sphingobium wenxiniae]